MKKSYLFAVIFAISAFLTSTFAGTVNSVGEVITERGSNCYTAVLHHSGKLQGDVATIYSLIAKEAKSIIGSFDFNFASWGIAAVGGVALLSGFDVIETVLTVAIVTPAWIKSDGKFNELTENEVKEHCKEVEDLAAYQIAHNSHKFSTLEAEMKEKVGTDVVEALKLQFGELKEEHFKHLENAVHEQGKEMGKLRDRNEKLALLKETTNGFMEELKQVWEKNADEIAVYARKNDKSSISFEMKAQVARSAVANNTMAQDVTGGGQIPRRSNAVTDLFNTGEVGADSNGIIRYWDQVTITSAAAPVAPITPALPAFGAYRSRSKWNG